MGVSQGSVRTAAKQIAQNTPTTGNLGVNLLLSDPEDFNRAIIQALQQFSIDRPSSIVADCVLAVAGFRQVLRGAGAILTGSEAWAATSSMKAVWYPWVVTTQGQEPLDPNDYRVVADPNQTDILEFLGITPAAGQTLRLAFTKGQALTEAPNAVADPTAAPTVALRGAGAGNVNTGLHSYQFTWVTAHGETLPSAAASVTVVSSASDGQVTVTVPASDEYGVTGAKVYRTVAGGAGSKLLVGSLGSNGGTFYDNVADGALGAAVPVANTAGGANTVNDEDEPVLAILVAAFILQMAANKAVQNTGNTNLPNDVVDRRSQSDIYRSRSKELRGEYDVLVGKGDSDSVGAASGFRDLDTELSAGIPYLWHGDR